MSGQFYKSKLGEPLTIAGFIRREVPADWSRWAVKDRRAWWAGAANNQYYHALGMTKKRKKIATIEIWCEFFGYDRNTYRQKFARPLNKFMVQKLKLTPVASSFRCGPYGTQRGFYIE